MGKREAVCLFFRGGHVRVFISLDRIFYLFLSEGEKGAVHNFISIKLGAVSIALLPLAAAVLPADEDARDRTQR